MKRYKETRDGNTGNKRITHKITIKSKQEPKLSNMMVSDFNVGSQQQL